MGIQEKFSWNAVAAAGIGALAGSAAGYFGGGGVVGSALGSAATQALTPGPNKFSWASVAAAAVGSQIGSGGGTMELAGKMTARVFVDAVSQRLFDGTDFDLALRNALPGVIGQTIGEAIAGQLSGRRSAGVARTAADDDAPPIFQLADDTFDTTMSLGDTTIPVSSGLYSAIPEGVAVTSGDVASAMLTLDELDVRPASVRDGVININPAYPRQRVEVLHDRPYTIVGVPLNGEIYWVFQASDGSQSDPIYAGVFSGQSQRTVDVPNIGIGGAATFHAYEGGVVSDFVGSFTSVLADHGQDLADLASYVWNQPVTAAENVGSAVKAAWQSGVDEAGLLFGGRWDVLGHQAAGAANGVWQGLQDEGARISNAWQSGNLALYLGDRAGHVAGFVGDGYMFGGAGDVLIGGAKLAGGGLKALSGYRLRADPLLLGVIGGGIKFVKAAKGAGRTGKQARLRELAQDPKVSSADRGWIKQELNSIARGTRTNIRVPPGKTLAHRRGFEAKKGFSYDYSDLQNVDLHKLQHKFEGY